MDIKVILGNIQESDADAIVVGLFEEDSPTGAAQAIDQMLAGSVQELIDAGDLSGKMGQTAVLYPRKAIPARRVIVVGLGPYQDFGRDAHRRTAAQALKKARDLEIKRVALALQSTQEIETEAQDIAEGGLLALYHYHGQKTTQSPKALPQTLELLVEDEKLLPAAERGVKTAQAIAAGVSTTRDLVNLPPNICTPAHMAKVAQGVAEKTGLRVQVLDKKEMQDLKMGALLGVAQGSDTPPHFIILEHNAGRAESLDTLVLAGKGVTFDTGGYNLKSTEGMATMKGDMAGAAAVIGAMRAIGELNPPLHVVGLAPAADNMISGHAYRPQEVVRASNGVTIEVINTDAEGRMLLADALVYAKRFQPAAVVDIATLTGACVTALGRVAAGLFSTDNGLRDALMAAADASAEKLWPLPLFKEYEKAIESETADIKNTGGRGKGVGTSATFLKHFVDYPAWAHIDMAGMGSEAQDNPYMPDKGATGFGVRLLTEFVRGWARDDQK